MKKIISAFLVASLLTSSHAFADPVASVSVDPLQVSGLTPIRKGQAAPYAGVLLTPKAVATIIAEKETEKEKIAAMVDAAVKTAEAKKDFQIAELKTNCETDIKNQKVIANANLEKVKLLEKTVKQLQDDMPNRTTWTVVGFVGGVAVTLATVFVVSQAVK